MKDEFNDESDLEGLWKKCTFVFDSAILMNLYIYPEEIYEEFINILENEIPNRIWMPHQISSEFEINSVHSMKKAAQHYKNFKSSVTLLQNDSKNLARNIKELNHTFFSSLKIDNTIQENFNEIDSILDGMSLSFKNSSDNRIKDKINALFNGKIGDNYPDSKLKKINNESKIRIIKGIHQGFEENGYSNLISWHQMLDYAKREKKDVVFITENPGWWTNQKKEVIEPHPSLTKEFSLIGQKFYICKFMDFLSNSKKYLNVSYINEEVDFSGKLKELESTKLESITSDIALQEIIDNTLLGESALQKLINQSTAYRTLKKLVDQKVIEESDLQQMISQKLIGESSLQKIINQNTAYGTLQKLIDQKFIDESDLQRMITRTIMSESILQKLIDQYR